MLEFFISILKRLNLLPVPLVDVQLPMCRARAILEANKLGVFKALNEKTGGVTTEALAKKIGVDREGAHVLLTALAATGYVRKVGGKYVNSSWSKRWLVDETKGIPNMMLFQIHGWDRLSELGKSIATGRPPMDYHSKAEEPSERQNKYTMAMQEMARLLLPSFKKHVKLPNEAKRVLDIGGAHGEYSRAMIQKFLGVEATILDLKGPIKTAKKISDEDGNSERIIFWEGNALHIDLGKNWDGVLLVNFIHLFNQDNVRNLFSKVYDALNRGGVLIIQDQFSGVNRIGDRVASLISLSYFTAGGRCYDNKMIKSLLREIGFSKIEMKPYILRTPTVLFHAWK